ncbi:hypothetical protein O6H91_18G031200 [Diphasiastrum complanatum]|uniref:Uncharacterized protein n=1 Tax=Diphasiastrum complanatum TaxID=34168 RepID=A0ACC2AZH3_DIPCM|nr:hypothetical protein O6H91_18G031200 [Diphasiastrum complanatum]
MAEAGVEASGLEAAANGRVAKENVETGGDPEKQFILGEDDKAKASLPTEKAQKNEGAEKDVKEGKLEAEIKGKDQREQGKAERGGKEEDSEMKDREVEERQEQAEDVPVKKKRGRKPKGAKIAAGEKQNSVAEKQEGESKKRKLSITEPLTPIDRPSRERKSIDRFVASTEKDKIKGVQILKGSGTALKDIPNVAYNLSKRNKADSILSSLHSLLYGGHRIKGTFIKNNILQFSGYVWGENEEKDKAKVKEKLDRFTKEGLIAFASLLDIKVSKTSIKKEELIVKLFEFLESPYQTTDELLEEKEQELKGKKRKSLTPGKRTRGRPPKKQKTDDTPAKRGRKKRQVFDEGSDEEVLEEEEEPESKTIQKDADEEVFEERMTPRKKFTKGKVTLVAKEEKASEEKKEKKRNLKTPPKLPSISKVDLKKESPKSTPKVFSRKDKKERDLKKEVKKEEKGKTGKESKATEKVQVKSNAKEKSVHLTGKKQAIKETSKQIGKGVAKGKETVKPEKAVQAFPTDAKLRDEICELLQVADFSKVTFTDVVKQLEAKFNVSLLEKKAHVKVLIREELSKITVGDDGEDKDEEQAVDADRNNA